MDEAVDGEMTDADAGARAVLAERRRLISIGYRLLGSLTEAEDAVQEAYARWFALPAGEQAEIRSPGAWLVTVTSRICLTWLTSARARHETYVGEWIPEPLPALSLVGDAPIGNGTEDPAERIALDESVRMALMVVMESMTPAERVAFVLHDVFCFSFAEIGEILGRGAGACRQLASSARHRITPSRATMTRAAQADVVRRFSRAWMAQDIDELIRLLDPGAIAVADGGGHAVTFAEPIEGGYRVAQAWAEIAGRTPDADVQEHAVNGLPGLIVRQDGEVVSVYAFHILGGRVARIWVVRNPEKLTAWAA